MHPRSPYGVAKLHGYWSVINMRESYGMFASNGILFNHESERRGENFVTRKITRAVARISLGLQDHLELGNMDAKRDWGYARDYVKAMHLMLQADEPGDFVIATGEAHSVREFVERAFAYVGIDIESNGKEGIDEVYYRKGTTDPVVVVNERFYRPAEVDYLLGDATKAKNVLGWSPEVSFVDLVDIMMSNDLALEMANVK
jgi:GDPmannose 4,6-dehydratase